MTKKARKETEKMMKFIEEFSTKLFNFVASTGIKPAYAIVPDDSPSITKLKNVKIIKSKDVKRILIVADADNIRSKAAPFQVEQFLSM